MPAGSAPTEVVRDLYDEEIAANMGSANRCALNAARYLATFGSID